MGGLSCSNFPHCISRVVSSNELTCFRTSLNSPHLLYFCIDPFSIVGALTSPLLMHDRSSSFAKLSEISVSSLISCTLGRRRADRLSPADETSPLVVDEESEC